MEKESIEVTREEAISHVIDLHLQKNNRWIFFCSNSKQVKTYNQEIRARLGFDESIQVNDRLMILCEISRKDSFVIVKTIGERRDLIDANGRITFHDLTVVTESNEELQLTAILCTGRKLSDKQIELIHSDFVERKKIDQTLEESEDKFINAKLVKFGYCAFFTRAQWRYASVILADLRNYPKNDFKPVWTNMLSQRAARKFMMIQDIP